MKVAANSATRDKNYLFLFMRTARIDVKKILVSECSPSNSIEQTLATRW